MLTKWVLIIQLTRERTKCEIALRSSTFRTSVIISSKLNFNSSADPYELEILVEINRKKWMLVKPWKGCHYFGPIVLVSAHDHWILSSIYCPLPLIFWQNLWTDQLEKFLISMKMHIILNDIWNGRILLFQTESVVLLIKKKQNFKILFARGERGILFLMIQKKYYRRNECARLKFRN